MQVAQNVPNKFIKTTNKTNFPGSLLSSIHIKSYAISIHGVLIKLDKREKKLVNET